MGARILVADDEDTLRSVIGRVLRRDGHDVVEAPSGEQALELFRKEPFPLVITDIVMGKMSGLELLEEIKRIAPDALVVVMTSHASLETATAALRSGAYDFLIKPFEDLALISAVVNRALERVRLITENQNLMTRLKEYARQLEKLNEDLRSMANRDGLTGLYNHRYFWESLEKELSRARRHRRAFSLIFLDIDYFKAYNDTHGHLAGDQVLKATAEMLEERCRHTDVVARYGGEEFVVLLPETDKEKASACAESIREMIEELPFQGRESQELGKVTVSLGVASFPEDGVDGIVLVDRADKAVYQAKRDGRNRVVVCHTAADARAVGAGEQTA